MSFHKRSIIGQQLYAAYAHRTNYTPPSNIISLEAYRMSVDTDAARRDRVIAERNDLAQRNAEMVLFIRELSQCSVGDDLWRFVERAKTIMGEVK